MSNASPNANARVPNATYSSPARIGSAGVGVGSAGVGVGSARLFRYQHVGIGTAKPLAFGV